MNVKVATLTLTSSGADGSATASDTFQTVTTGKVFAIKVDHSAGQAATTDLTVSWNGLTILTVANSATDATYFPRVLLDGEDGAALTAVYDYFYVAGNLTASLAQADNNETTALTVYVIED